MKTLIAFALAIFAVPAAVVPVSQTQVAGKTVNSCSGPQVWRLIYTNGKVIGEFQANGTTRTMQSLFCATTKPEADAAATALHLAPADAKQTTPSKDRSKTK